MAYVLSLPETFLLQASPHVAKSFQSPGSKIEVLVSQQAAMFLACVSNTFVHKVKTALSDTG